MNPTYHEVASVAALPVVTTAGRKLQLYTLVLQYRAGGERERICDVYVPRAFLPTLVGGDVTGVYIETLSFNGLEHWLLPDTPSNILLGVATRNGAFHIQLASTLLWARRLLGALALAFCIGGAILLLRNAPWSGALALVAGTQMAMAFIRLPAIPSQPAPSPPAK